MPNNLIMSLWNWWFEKTWKLTLAMAVNLVMWRFIYVNLIHMQVKTCIFLISKWFNMLSILVKNEKFCKLFFVLSFILSAVFFENPVDVVHLGAQQGYKHRRKYTPFVGTVRIDKLEHRFFLLYVLRIAFLGLCYLNVNFY